jgi:hypothetical protein
LTTSAKLGDVFVRIGRIVIVVSIAAGLLMMLAAPASAHNLELRHEEDLGYIRENHTLAIASDLECDGNVVVVEYYYTTIGGSVYGEVVDGDGCDNGGNRRSTYPQRITRARICERGIGPYPGCGPWVNA